MTKQAGWRDPAGEVRRRRRRTARVVVAALLGFLVIPTAIAAFFIGVVFAPGQRDGFSLQSASCEVYPSAPNRATLSVVLDHLDARWEPFVLYSDIDTTGGVTQAANDDSDRPVDDGTELILPIGRNSELQRVEAHQLRVGWSSGEPGFYQDFALELEWDETGCRVR